MREFLAMLLLSCAAIVAPVGAGGRESDPSSKDIRPVTLAITHVVQGTVTDNGFFPISGADIDIRPAGQRDKLDISGDNTDGSGAYSIDVPEGVYDITASGPIGAPYAAVTARSITVFANTTMPNLVLPPGFELRGLCQNALLAHVADVDVDLDSLPLLRRLETKNDNSDTSGVFKVQVPSGKFRLTLSPTVASKLIPVRFDSIQITGPLDVGAITFAAGHWVSGRVLDQASGISIVDANLDFIRKSDGHVAITPGDMTDSNGAFKVVTDGTLYRLRVVPPSVQWDTLWIDPFRSLNDTTLTLRLHRRTVGVAPGGGGPGLLSLAPPSPNPARGRVTFAFAAGSPWSELSVWDASGRRVATLFRGLADRRVAHWDGRDARGRALPAGVYLVRLSDGSRSVSHRFALIR